MPGRTDWSLEKAVVVVMQESVVTRAGCKLEGEYSIKIFIMRSR